MTPSPSPPGIRNRSQPVRLFHSIGYHVPPVTQYCIKSTRSPLSEEWVSEVRSSWKQLTISARNNRKTVGITCGRNSDLNDTVLNKTSAPSTPPPASSGSLWFRADNMSPVHHQCSASVSPSLSAAATHWTVWLIDSTPRDWSWARMLSAKLLSCGPINVAALLARSDAAVVEAFSSVCAMAKWFMGAICVHEGYY